MTGKLNGKLAIVTGSDSGIGQAIAIEFAREGASVAISYFKDRAGAEATQRDVEATGQRAFVLQLDQRDPAAVDRAFGDIQKQLGTPFILVNDAGVDTAGKPVAEMSLTSGMIGFGLTFTVRSIAVNISFERESTPEVGERSSI